eukprot:m.24549 g.24549  ORF g.24549 m.24549 type:complete len:919 (+) comp11276_c0_seq1:225-2981(+)
MEVEGVAGPASDGSVIFKPYRALGEVCSHIPVAVQHRGNDHFVTTVVGDAYHIYNCKKLNLVSVGLVGHPIRCVAVSKELVFVAERGGVVSSWRRGRKEKDYTLHDTPVVMILVLGSLLLTLDEENVVVVYTIATGEVFVEFDDLDESHFAVTAMAHPGTYLNKVLLGSRQGRLQIWNVRSRRMVFEFAGHRSAVSCLEPAPVLDVVAVGHEDGCVVLQDLKQDSVAMKLYQEGGAITAVSFRTDGLQMMASGNNTGSIAIWNLEEKSVHSVIHDAHGSAVTALKYLASQPVLLSAGACNSLKMWAFDQSDNGSRLLRLREGHSLPPTKARYYGVDGRFVLSAGKDRALRAFCLYSDSRSHEMSQGSLTKRAKHVGLAPEELKLPPITDFAAEEVREREWDNVVTTHARDGVARTWRWENKRLGSHKLEPKTHGGPPREAKSVAMSACGNFAIVGYSTGHVEKFNVQSGLHRGSFGKRAHTAAVRAVACDALNRIVTTVGQDGFVKTWDFGSGKLRWKTSVDSPVIAAELHRESALLAVACQDYSVLVVDIEGQRVVRTFAGHSNRITDIAWSPDGRWLLSAGMDNTIRVWDVPTGCAISRVRVASAATSLAFSPTADYLATTHVDRLGVYLWANCTMYTDAVVKPLEAPSDDEEDERVGATTALPKTRGISAMVDGRAFKAHVEDEDEVDDDEVGAAAVAAAGDMELDTPQQMGGDLVTLSSMPKSRWANLSKLADIKQRNKPTEAPKAPKSAPFFIPTKEGLTSEFAFADEDRPDPSADGSRVINFGKIGVVSPFQKALIRAGDVGGYAEFAGTLKTLTPSQIDLEIRSLVVDDELDQPRHFLAFIAHQLKAKRDFELTQAYLHLFLKVHGDVLRGADEVAEVLRTTLTEHDICWVHLEGLFQHALCTINFLKGQV